MEGLLVSKKRICLGAFKRYWFLVGLGFAIGLAWAIPDVGKTNGVLQAQYTIRWGAVILIFLLSGLGIEVRELFHTFLQWRLHLVVQIISFVIMPLAMYVVTYIFMTSNAPMGNMMYKGWIIALSTSTTVSSNAIMTRNAGGNDGAALFNAAVGNIMGVFISPALIELFENDTTLFPPGTERGDPNYLSILKTMGLTVLLPLVAGQAIRYLFPKQTTYLAAKLHFPIINSLALIVLVWSVFCDGVASNAFVNMKTVDILAILFVDMFMYLFGCGLCLFVARLPWPTRLIREPVWVKRWRFSKRDAVAIMYCGSTKAASMGIVLINVLYNKSSYDVVGVLSLPSLLYHISQLFLGNFQVGFLKKWVKEGERESMEPDEHMDPSYETRMSLPRFTKGQVITDEMKQVNSPPQLAPTA
ncbi:putative sodium bile acid cotransporter [Phycomyces nitens]|nr:putative sodium bile acid cotransporter [Phycomyces nitens]